MNDKQHFNFTCQNKKCMHLNIDTKDQVDASTEGYIANCTKCKEEHVVCLYPNCYHSFLSSKSTKNKDRRKPWSYFIAKHYNPVHVDPIKYKRRKIESDVHLDDVVDFGTGNDANTFVELGQSTHLLPDIFVENMDEMDDREESIDETEEIHTIISVEDELGNDEGTDHGDDNSICRILKDDSEYLNPETIESIIDEETMTEDADNGYQGLISEYVFADIDPESVDGISKEEYLCRYDEDPESEDVTEESQTNRDNLVEEMIDEKYSAMKQIYDWRSDEERVKDKRTSMDSLSQVALYFAQKHCMLLKNSNDHFGGYRGLVQRAFSSNRNEKYKMADNSESLVIFLYHLLVMKLKEKEHGLLLQYEEEKLQLLGVLETIQHAIKIDLPKTASDVRRLIFRGASSIMKNFPSQRVFSIDGHGCVSLRQTFCIAAGHFGGFQFAWDGGAQERNLDGLNGCNRVGKLCRNTVKTMLANGFTSEEAKRTNLGYITLWSDSFLKSFIKQKDNSVWLLTATISPPSHAASAGIYTYVLAMGKSSNDHTEVIKYYLGEIREMQRGFECYFVDRNEIQRTALFLAAYVADRPEKSKIRNTRTKGHFGKVTDWAVHISTDPFPACKKCYVILVNKLLGIDTEMSQISGCSRCLCWTLDESHNPEHYHKTRGDYPRERIPNRKVPKGRCPCASYLGPKKLSNKWLIAAVEYAYDARRMGLWTKPNVMEYLRTCNISEELSQRVNEIAENDSRYERVSPKDQYIPDVWLHDDLFLGYMCYDAPMHAFCHSIIVEVMNAIHQIFAHSRRMTNYFEFANVLCKRLASFNLEWLKIKSLPKAAWIGENTMAYMRIMSYSYGMYFLNGSFNKEFKGTIMNIKRLLNSLQSAASMFMAEGDIDGEKMKLSIQVLLSNEHHLQKEYGSLDCKNVAGNGKDSSKRHKGVVDNIKPADAVALLTSLGKSSNNDDSCSKRKSQLKNIKKDVLIKELSDRGETVSTNVLKEDLQKNSLKNTWATTRYRHKQRGTGTNTYGRKQE